MSRPRRPRAAAALLLPALLIGVAGTVSGCGGDDGSDGAPGTSAEATTPGADGSDAPQGGNDGGERGRDGAHPIQVRLVDEDAEAPRADCAAEPVWVEPEEEMTACAPDPAGSGPDEVVRLEPADIVGGVLDATSALPDGMVSYVVTVQFDHAAAKRIEKLSRQLAGTEQRVAFVVEGRIVVASTFAGPVPGGQLQISGDFTKKQAATLADRIAAGG